MLNLDETLELYNDYILQRDAYIKSILYSAGTITFLDIIFSFDSILTAVGLIRNVAIILYYTII
jgi:predicted tellurium resistance membrane protein TerC